MVELLVAVAIVGVLAALLLGAFGPGRTLARRAACDGHVKALVIALDAFHQETGHYPRALSELVAKHYISDPEMLRCADDPDEKSTGYEAAYILRGGRNDPRFADLLPVIGQLPVLVCPFHEAHGVGVQGFGGLQTHQFSTRPAILVSGSAAWVRRGEEVLPAQAGMPLHGGDVIETQGGGAALIQFFDGSRCELGGGSKVSVLQSFLQNGDGSLYTLLRQSLGNVAYSVRHGSKFDVSTPTATAGALGTEFQIAINGVAGQPGYSEWWINSSENETSQVSCAMPRHTTIIARHQWVNVGEQSLSQLPINGSGGAGTAATPQPTAAPTPDDDTRNGGGKGDDNKGED